jgi:hypothetical protein
MKSYCRKAIAAALLALVLASSALAGEMQTGFAAPSPDATTAGEMQTGIAATSDTVTGIALDLLQNLLALA